MKTILIADDEPGIRNITALMLQDAGYETLQACNGEEALKIMETTQPTVHLLLTDVDMGDGINGIDLAKQVRALYPHITVLVMSGTISAETARQTEASIPFLPKPFTPAELLAQVRRIIG